MKLSVTWVLAEKRAGGGGGNEVNWLRQSTRLRVPGKDLSSSIFEHCAFGRVEALRALIGSGDLRPRLSSIVASRLLNVEARIPGVASRLANGKVRTAPSAEWKRFAR